MTRKFLSMLLAALFLCSALAGCSSKSSAAESTVTEAAEETAAETEAAEEETEAPEEPAAAAEVGTGDAYSADGSDEHALSVSGETAVYDNISVSKTGDSSGDESDFYGTNAAVYAENGADLTVTNSKIVTDGSHANAVFSYGEGTKLTISDSVIETSQNNSGGIMVTGGGELNASNLQVTTQGGSSAAIRSDRGGGSMTVEGGSYASYGSGSPAIYSTADITVSDAELYSDISQAVVVEGKNSVTLIDCDAVGKNTKKNSDNSDTFQAVMVYQSMSGDAAEGEGRFSMTGGSLTSLNGGMFFVTNTVAEISLEDVALTYATDDLLRIEAAGWGNEGSNGGQVNFRASNQELAGIISVDEISKLNLYLTDGSVFEGSVDSDGQVYVELSGGSVWKLTGDSVISGLTCDADSIDLNGYTLTVDGRAYTAGTAMSGEALEFDYSSGGHDGMGGPGGEGGDMTPPDGMGGGQGGPGGQGGDMTPPDGEAGGQGGPGGQGGDMTPPDGEGGGQGGPGSGEEPPAKPE